MKKIISLILSLTTVISVLCFGIIESSAFLGTGAEVIATDVNLIKTGLVGKKLCFTDSDFKSALCLTDFNTITITEIPASTEGTLLIGGRRVGKGRVIKRKNLASLMFVPASASVTEATFKFTVDEYAGGAEIECIMKFIDKVNYAPDTANAATEASTVKTQESISVYGTLFAKDPEGDTMNYIIVSYPKHGSVEVIDKENGKYKYTPVDNFKGKDKFSYVARDEYGNYSELTTVSVKVTGRMCETVYRDMEDREEYNAAVAMTAMSIMDGRMLGDDYYFQPDEKVSRAEFITMAMKCAGIRPDSSLTSTYFDDDSDISVSLKGYVATAQKIGLVNGDFKNGKLVLMPNEEITKYEAAKILATIIGYNEGEETVFADNDEIPVWARAGVYAMCSLGVFDDADNASLTETVTRADVASYLYKISEII